MKEIVEQSGWLTHPCPNPNKRLIYQITFA